MLVSVTFYSPTAYNRRVLAVSGKDMVWAEVETGIYIGPLNPHLCVAGMHEWQEYAFPLVDNNLDMPPYGVCDSIEQFKEHFADELREAVAHYVVFLTPVRREDQSPEGGWRWHKWGPYIGKYIPQHEYLYDENIDEVYVFRIWRRKL